MLRPPTARHVDRPVLASLEALVPPGHCSRHLEAALDRRGVRGATAADREPAARGLPTGRRRRPGPRRGARGADARGAA